MKKTYRVTNVELLKTSHQGDTLTWDYAGKLYSCTGEFYVDEKGYLHHLFVTPNGREISIKVKYSI